MIVTSVTYALSMSIGSYYMFISSTNCFIKQTDAGTAATGATGSQWLPANTPIFLRGSHGAKLSVIRDTADGKASLTSCEL